MTYNQAKAELKNWQDDLSQDNFHSLLYCLISKSDPENREALRLGFPNEVQVFEDWNDAESPKQFFAS